MELNSIGQRSVALTSRPAHELADQPAKLKNRVPRVRLEEKQSSTWTQQRLNVTQHPRRILQVEQIARHYIVKCSTAQLTREIADRQDPHHGAERSEVLRDA